MPCHFRNDEGQQMKLSQMPDSEVNSELNRRLLKKERWRSGVRKTAIIICLIAVGLWALGFYLKP
jgi:hypothetical protein